MLESAQLRAPDDSSGGSFVPTVSIDPSAAARGRPLAELLAAVPLARVHGGPDVSVLDVTYRSSECRTGSLFFCVRGTHVDGHDFAPRAVGAGAVAVVVERVLDVPGTQVVVPSVRTAMGPMSAAFFGRPSDHLTVIGITGTNGKTTTTYLLESILRAGGRVAGVIGTTGVRIDGR